MKLTRIKATGIQNGDFDYQLSPFTVFIGDNEAGKTRVLNAVTALLLGFVPSIGKTAQATFGLANGPVLMIEGWTDTGVRLWRRWSLNGNSVRSENEIPKEIADYDGLALMFNAAEYFGLSEDKRVAYVAAHCNIPAGLDRLGILARLKANVEKSDEMVDQVNGDLVSSESPMSLFLENFILAFSEKWKTEKAVAIRAEKTIQQLTDMRLKDEPTTPLAVLEDRRAKATRELGELNEKKGRVIGSFTQMKNDAQRRATIAREISFGDKNRAQLAELKDKLALVVRTLEIESPVTQEMVSATAAAVEMAIQQKTEALRLKAAADTAKDTAEKRLAHLDGEYACPYCGAKGETWKAQKSADLAQEMGAAEVESAKQHKRVEELTVVVNEARNAHLLTLQQQRNQQDLLTEKSQLLSKIASLEPQVSRLETLADEAKRLMADDPNLTVQVEMLQSEINIKNEEIRQVDGEIKAVNGRAFELKRLADAEKERDDAKVSQELAASIGKELRAIQAETVAAAFRPLIETANRIFGPLFKTPLAYHEGEVGTWRAGVWVGHKTFSGSQKLMTYCAIQAALSAQSPVKLFLTDELKAIHSSRLDQFIACVKSAIEAGDIDQVIGAEPERQNYYAAAADSAFQVISV